MTGGAEGNPEPGSDTDSRESSVARDLPPAYVVPVHTHAQTRGYLPTAPDAPPAYVLDAAREAREAQEREEQKEREYQERDAADMAWLDDPVVVAHYERQHVEVVKRAGGLFACHRSWSVCILGSCFCLGSPCCLWAYHRGWEDNHYASYPEHARCSCYYGCLIPCALCQEQRLVDTWAELRFEDRKAPRTEEMKDAARRHRQAHNYPCVLAAEGDIQLP
jgi:hypothetical protein